MPYISRADWGAAPAVKTLPVSRNLLGVCIHWMGFPIHTDPASITASIQRAHMSPPRGWFDVAYNELIGLDGTVVEGRGLLHRSGAQGGTRNNRGYLALGLLLGPGQHPTDEMVAAARERIAIVRYFQPSASAIVGHQELKPTQCPGDEVMALIRAGAFEPGGEPLPAEIVAPEFPEPEGLVRRGDRGDDVRWVQHHLARHGFKVVVDGVLGRKSERAIRSFQRRNGLQADGIVGRASRTALGA
jgi:hypothetical protein